MSFWASLPIIGEIIKGITNVIDKSVEDKDEANRLKAQVTQYFGQLDMDQINARMKIIVAEAMGDSWLQRNWRPGLMALFGIIIANNYIIYPFLRLFWPEAPVLTIPPDMWDLLKLGIGGYIVGRSGEKVIEAWKGQKE